MKVVRYTMFDSVINGNGADKRTAQITEILSDAGITSVVLKYDDNIRVSIAYVLFRAIPVYFDLVKVVPYSSFKNIRKIFKAIREFIITEKILGPSFKQGAKVLIWECTRSNNFFVPIISKKHKIKLISLPHNIESLVPMQRSVVSTKSSPHWFNEELKYLSFSDCIFCISKEEMLFLKLFGLNSHYLPYFPTRDTETFFSGIRAIRENKIKSTDKLNILMLGSANNPPTRLGMIDRIKFFRDHNLKVNVTIAGFYTQTLCEEMDIPCYIRLAGTLDAGNLEKELIHTDVLLIHQVASTGALTRIPEVLLAGVPIIANLESVRNYHNLSGIQVYQTDEQLIELLENFVSPEVCTIIKPFSEQKMFIDKILQ